MDGKTYEAMIGHFRELLLEQEQRALAMESESSTDFTARPLNIGVVGGDGIGPIIVSVAERALAYLLREEIADGSITLRNIEGLTLENRLAKNESIPAEVLDEIRQCQVLLKGPTTTPSGGTMTSANVTMRRELDLFANVRPVSVPEKGIDWTIFRENTEGEYTLGSRGVEIPGVMSMDFKVITVAGTRRIAKAAFDYARASGKKRVTVVTKSNIMKKTDGLFSEVCAEVAKNYPEIETDEYFVDIMSANFLKPSMQKEIQVILTPNLYGDILSDEAAQIQGGVGTAGSANIGSRYAMFEAIHGSAMRMIERGDGDYANPESILQAAAMLLEHIGCADKATALRRSMQACKENGECVTGSASGLTCQAFGDALLARLADAK